MRRMVVSGGLMKAPQVHQDSENVETICTSSTAACLHQKRLLVTWHVLGVASICNSHHSGQHVTVYASTCNTGPLQCICHELQIVTY